VVSDIKPIAEDMRKSDVEEILASHGRKPMESLAAGYAESTMCFTVEHKGVPCAMFGAVPQTLLGERANIWLLASNDFCKCHLKIVRHSKIFIRYMLEHYQILENYVHVGNKASINWLKHCGADMGDVIPFGKNGEFFRKFTFRREDYAHTA
jgi:hypothetical protein